jgi:hypothetical protein
MPPRRDPANPAKRNPTGVRPARRNTRWELQGTVGDFVPDAVPSKRETLILTAQERAAGVTKLDVATRFEWAKGEIVSDIVSGEVVAGVEPDRVRQLRN